MPLFSPALLACLLAAAAVDAPPPAAEPPPVTAPEVQPPPLPDAARPAYDEAFKLMAAHRWADAAKAFHALIAAHPESPEAPLSVEMERLAQTLAADHLELREPAMGESLAAASNDRAGRVELLTNTTIFGLWTGGAVAIIADTGATSLLLVALGGGAGLGVGYLATEGHAISPGGASLIGTAMLLGSYDGVMSMLLAGNSDSSVLVGASVVGGLVLTGVAALAQANLHISTGTSAMITSGAFMGTFLAGMILLTTADANPRTSIVEGALLAGTNLGAAGMAIAAAYIQPSRGRVILCGVGGFLGGLLVGGVLVAVAPDTTEKPLVAGLLTAGVAAGAGLGIFLTRHYDDSDPEAQPAPAATHTASLESPSLWVRPHHGSTTSAVGLNVLQGAF